MSKTARRAQIGAVIELLCDRFPQTFNRRGPWPLEVGLHTDLLAALGDAVRLRSGPTTPEDEAFAKERLAELAKGIAPPAKATRTGQTGPETPAMRPASQIEKPAAPEGCR